ncbi:hypothetical protein K431DRAFT_275483 [Polychaeton citri CBS 116435]|uniref:NFX1-type zinc finger-containing protein 1 n=1 Tax=Polychaeton citri CBS 116435 TaxID=1314669 RepID=A0A9P4Q4R4_9PEZI|nr:hypothetical protein K431DRAFT_275483 [Polychaeton citri CBS 116435]
MNDRRQLHRYSGGGRRAFGKSRDSFHEQAPTFKRKPCSYFSKGNCRRGDDCKFSHDTSVTAQNRVTHHRNQEHDPDASSIRGRYIKWRYYIPRDAGYVVRASPLGTQLPLFIGQALDLVNAGVEAMQDVITSLAGEGGLHRLRELLDFELETLDHEKAKSVFEARLYPLMQILSHEFILVSVVAEARHATLLNFLYGIDGSRAIDTFKLAIRACTTEDGASDMIEPCLITLSGIFDVNSSATVNTGLRAVAKDMIKLVSSHVLSGSVRKYHRKLCVRLELGESVTKVTSKSKECHQIKAKFKIEVDWPGNLSKTGPRHDNDHTDIRAIQIMPTVGEINSDRSEYLPQDSPEEWHLKGLPGLLDRQFRLLREDTVGQLRDAARFELQRLQNAPREHQSRSDGARTNVYPRVRLFCSDADDYKGLQFVLALDQPSEMRNKSLKQRMEWWSGSKKLDPETLICLMTSDGFFIFATVATTTRQKPSSIKAEDELLERPIEERFSRWGEETTAYVVIQAINPTRDDINSLTFFCGQGKNNPQNISFSLLEFPGIVLPAFMHTLAALQQMSSTKDLPFPDMLVPTDESDQCIPHMTLPAYAQKRGFQYDASALSTDEEPLVIDPESPMTSDALSKSTGLDRTQAEALIAALTHSLALIQGPPGTGKSYTGIALLKLLLANKQRGRLGPIICVTFTNHALDQSLEHLVRAGVKQIIRIGSRSKSEVLAPLNLRFVAKGYGLTKMEKSERWQARSEMEYSSKRIKDTLRELHLAKSEKSVKTFLAQHHANYYMEIFQDHADHEGFIRAKDKRHPKGLKAWLQGNRSSLSNSNKLDEASNCRKSRWELYRTWINEIIEPIQQELLLHLDAFNEAKSEHEKICGDLDLRVLSHANIIGVTTSGLARNLDTLRRLDAKVLLVEEAGEVLESHLLTAMLPSIEHAILIGDHQQLRPKVQNYELSCENPRSHTRLDISLFERLIHPSGNIPGHPHVTLQTQRRMHPSISQLIRTALYPNLVDAETVLGYPEVSGMRHRLFWMNHNKEEDGGHDQAQSISHTNSHEVDMVFALVRHLIRQDAYRANDIAVLTPYLGQLRKLRYALSGFTDIVLNDRDTDELTQVSGGQSEEGINHSVEAPPQGAIGKISLSQAIRLATVDNFQGEEAKVVIISLVRSNSQRKCGFLRTSNRINVLLSRARHGMYIIGNTATSAHVPMWNQVLEILGKDQLVGDHLQLRCSRHPEDNLQVKEPDDFATVSPEAGCNLMCTKMLGCGHSCVSKCHSEKMHEAFYCTKPCTRLMKGCEHSCPYVCGQKCDVHCKQQVSARGAQLPCGHEVPDMPCWQMQKLATYKCQVQMQRKIPGCGHVAVLPCHVAVENAEYQCMAVCSTLLSCGHACKSRCRDCRLRLNGSVVGEEHKPCVQPCGRPYTQCKHVCQAKCHGDRPCQLCPGACDTRCNHGKCAKKCHEPCTPCAEEKCASRCPHSACSMPCAAPCDWIPCSKRCEKHLSCGHQCPSICGAECPNSTFCQTCAPENVKDLRADLVMLSAYSEIDLEENPVIVTPCGHVFTIESLDGHLSMSDYYNVDTMTGVPISLKCSSKPFSYDEMKTCPDCRGSLSNISRYGRIVRRALLDESTKRFITWSNLAHNDLAETLQKVQAELLESSETASMSPKSRVLLDNAIQTDVQVLRHLSVLDKRYRPIYDLTMEVSRFLERVKFEEQPFMRVHDMVEALRRGRSQSEATATTSEFRIDETVLQTRGQLLATSLQIRCNIVGIHDFVRVSNKNGPGVIKADFSANRTACETLIARSERSINPLQQVEGHVFWARFAIFECRTMDAGSHAEKTSSFETLTRAANEHLDMAKAVRKAYPGQTQAIASELEEASRMLNESDYHSQMLMVVAAMQKEFSGTGHWYTCVNGHPFTIGECGMPMQTARCPQCNAVIGGSNHTAADGVSHAQDIEERFLQMRL